MSTEESQDDSPEEEEDLQYFVRIGGADLDGTKTVERSLSELDGIGTRTARLVAEKADVDRNATFGLLDEDDIDAVVDIAENLEDHVPSWMTNRQNDFFSGETTHLVGTDVNEKRRHDINRMKIIESYKGVRHKRGQKVRGQRTKSTGRSEGTIGVNVEEIREEMADDEAGDEE
ncbi:30S ribosomal protein S13 [Halorubrum sp. E3]|uniref:Small ribosomal subunit protein uS13 n=6 Tax=Halorubrum distributum TaxID=29283 RepID=M0F3B2_9EURY|nr:MULTISPECIES: 30S ribosomal protein S13 [Halorubrum distributum group]OYR97868.1 30S ribosomal protein S13 [Halorubrum sp. E3]PHQ45566.1 30S ribosomal protein S13 [Halorubrum sp. C3]ELZ32950.1 30S ribosomal protein S13P [Halorubrum terrestre JCM 10247]ELZ53848.1 30S ribosomal protein S13P [Halorubrum distributum JCM 9100]ELZ56033.1 30S ribosomal protein S13P [Halorubrum distributum JCM 10118]